MSLETPLSDSDDADLAGFLASRHGAMDLETLDGFFCALIIGTRSISPGKWMPRVLGDGELAWQSDAQMEHVLALLLRKWNSVAAGFREDWGELEHARIREQMYLPDVDLQSESPQPALASRWARGVGTGLAMLGPELMQRIHANTEAVDTLGLIAALDRGETAEGRALTHGERKTVLANIVVGLQHLYRDLRAPAETNSESEGQSRPGRNDPCPCGSGRKFKKCCGSPQRLH